MNRDVKRILTVKPIFTELSRQTILQDVKGRGVIRHTVVSHFHAQDKIKSRRNLLEFLRETWAWEVGGVGAWQRCVCSRTLSRESTEYK
jgi:hypothetical protein